jgi:hypothetical protein
VSDQPKDLADLEGIDLWAPESKGTPMLLPDQTSEGASSDLRFRPFPIHVIPSAAVRDYITGTADRLCVDPSAVAAFVLPALGSAIGMTRVLHDSYSDWTETALIYSAVVSESGTRKSPIFRSVFSFHEKLQRRKARQYEEALREYKRDTDERNRDNKKAGAKRDKPEEPLPEHVCVTDTTVEAAVQTLVGSPRGILVKDDELSAFFGGVGRYKQDRMGDRAFWLRAFHGDPFKVDRRGNGMTYLPRVAASIAGCVQPKVLARCFDDQTVASGLAARFLLVCPPRKRKEYREANPAADREYSSVVEKLFELRMQEGVDEEGETLEPVRIDLAEDAREVLSKFVPAWDTESAGAEEQIQAALAKLEGYALRFALIFRLIREVEGTVEASTPVGRADLVAGIELARWFRCEAERVYALLAGRGVRPELRAFVRKLEGMGGATSVRDWMRAAPKVPTSAAAERELEQLVAAGIAERAYPKPGAGGGAPTVVYRMVGHPGDETPARKA